MSRRESFGRKVVCPFFKAVNEWTISCEGIIPNTTVRTSFHGYTNLTKYVKNVCFDDKACENCPIYKAHQEKYK